MADSARAKAKSSSITYHPERLANLGRRGRTRRGGLLRTRAAFALSQREDIARNHVKVRFLGVWVDIRVRIESAVECDL